MKNNRVNILIYVSTILILFTSFFLLVHVRSQFSSEMESTIKSIKTHFSMETVLKSPDDIQISFSRISEVVNNNLRNPFIRDLYVSKILRDKGEHLVHPFYFSAKYPDWKNMVKNKSWRCEPLVYDGNVYGYLYIKLNKAALNNVTAAAVIIACMLLLSIVFFISRLHSQEQALSKTAIELNEKQREMIHLERLALAGKLTANIFHDIKKPILNIKHEISDNEEVENSPETNITINRIRGQIEIFFSMLRELNIERFVQKGDDSEKEYSDINELLDKSLNLVKYEQEDVNIKKEYSGSIPPALVNPRHIMQVFSNIILNAYQAMNRSGELSLSTYYDTGKIIVKIKDNGPGIPDEIKARLFDPFFSTKKQEEGSGLGLYISRNIIKAAGGEIFVESEPGKGTAFIIKLKTENIEQK